MESNSRIPNNNEEQLLIEQKGMFDYIKVGLPRLSSREVARLLLALVSPDTQTNTYTKRFKTQNIKALYTFCNKVLSVKYAKIFSQLLKNKQDTEKKSEIKDASENTTKEDWAKDDSGASPFIKQD
jgi:hypothetical protein